MDGGQDLCRLVFKLCGIGQLKICCQSFRQAVLRFPVFGKDKDARAVWRTVSANVLELAFEQLVTR